MKRIIHAHLEQQEKVNAYFKSRSSYWQEVYSRGGVQAEIIRDRHIAVLDWVDSLALAPDAQMLEVGCGAGFMAVALAMRGFRVHAIDSAEAMVERVCRNAEASGTSDLLSLDVGDVYSLAYEDESFDLVIAIGVIPWLEHAELAMQEMARVTKAGGYVIVTTANCAGLTSLLDPIVSPVLRPIKLLVKNALIKAGLRHWLPSMTFHSNRSIDKALMRLNLVKTKGMTRGFGFSFLRHSLLPEPLATALHYRLQRLTDQNVPGFRSIGMAYCVLARKSASPSFPLVQLKGARQAVSEATIV
ncbi:MAG: hypothetical protein NVSMB27_08440 [Ktedonobacteraceae bacterium]